MPSAAARFTLVVQWSTLIQANQLIPITMPASISY
jgi:hypothetical protein